MTLKKQFPIKDGWLHLKITLKRGVTFTEDDVRKYLSMFGSKDAEIGHIDVSRNPVVVAYREKKRTHLGGNHVIGHESASLPSAH